METAPVQAVVTNGVRNTGRTLRAVDHACNTVLVEWVKFTNGFGGQFVHTAQTNGTPVATFQTNVCSAIPVSGFAANIRTIALFQGTVSQFETFFQFEGRCLTGTQIFYTTESDTVVDVFTHLPAAAGFLDETGIDDTVDGYVGLCMGYACSSTQHSQCD